jgi:hypothetical protein
VTYPTTCIQCAKRRCEHSDPGELGVCDYDIAYYNDGGTVIRKEPAVPLRMVCTNLRHELHHVLHLIVEQTTIIDPKISIRRINLDNPASRILAATIIIDHFIQMLTGVYEFHPSYGGEHLSRGRSYAEIVTKYFAVYSIVKGARRPANLRLQLNFDRSMVVPYCVDVYEYLTSILIDNAWKYSVADTAISVTVNEKPDSRADISFSNVSKPIPKELDIFARGIKGSQETEGFGYGLHWGTILVDHYNRQMRRTKDLLDITHAQLLREDGLADQTFTLVNADMTREE